MARTAPVPNIPPVPGMCPSVAVLGGGGAGGGGSGDGTGDGDGNGPDGGAGTGDGASGDGKNGGEGCGDPVCPVTGRVFVDFLDFGFAGPYPLRWIRSYSSRTSHRARDLGYGWAHPLSWELTIARASAMLRDDKAKLLPFEELPTLNGPRVKNGVGWKLALEPRGYVLYLKEGKKVLFGAATEDGVHRATALIDRHDNRIVCERDQRGAIKRIIDSAGRPYRVEIDAEGRLVRIAVATDADAGSWMDVVRYTYSDKGDLELAVDAEGASDRYGYENHLIVEHRAPQGLSYCYRYDGADHSAYCVETWGEYIGKTDPALEHPLPVRPVGPDNRAVKGIHYVKLTYDKLTRYCEVENGIGGLDRYFGDEHGRVVRHVTKTGGVVDRTYDDQGSLTSYTETDGSTVPISRDEMGEPVGTSGANGQLIRTEAPDGSIIETNADTGAIVQRRYDLRGDLVFVKHSDGTWEEYTYDTRGLRLSHVDRTGANTAWEYDAQGNCVAELRPEGVVSVSEYDYLGRQIEHHNGYGGVTKWTWDRRSEAVWKEHPDGTTFRMEYDPVRRVTLVDDHGRITRRAYGGMGWLIELVEPDGSKTEYRYDPEGNLTWMKNPRGQVFRQEFDKASRWIGCVTFEGVVIRAKRDIDGNIVSVTTPVGSEKAEYDRFGRIVAAETSDGRTMSVAYDARGLIAMDNGIVPIERTLDALGRVVTERQGKHQMNVAWRAGDLSTVTADVGLPIQYALGTAGYLEKIVVGQAEVTLGKKAGADDLTLLGDNLCLRRAVGPTGLLLFQGLSRMSPIVSEEKLATEDDPNVIWWKRYEYTSAQNVSKETRSDGKIILFETDIRGSVVRRTVLDKGRTVEEEVIGYDAAGSPRVANATYDAEARAKTLGNESFEYDAAGRLVKRVTDAGEWAYRWDTSDNLIEVTAPKHSVQMDYDARGRRTQKRVYRKKELVSKRSYLWSEQTILFECDELSGASRTYVRDNSSWRYLGHVDASAAGTTTAYYLCGLADTVEAAIDPSGKIRWASESTVFGARTIVEADIDVTLRFQNQHWDEDVGLVYNRFRWYDPRLGQYVSPDPKLLDGTINPRDYVTNPMRETDPLGLAKRRPTKPGEANSKPQPPANGHPPRPPRPGSIDDMDQEYMTNPGHFATNGDPGTPGFIPCPDDALNAAGDKLNDADGGGGKTVRQRMDEAGKKFGCHTCGTTNPNGPDATSTAGHFVADHIPPASSYNKGKARNSDLPAATTKEMSGNVRLYPQCRQCSSGQGGLMAHADDADKAQLKKDGLGRNDEKAEKPPPKKKPPKKKAKTT